VYFDCGPLSVEPHILLEAQTILAKTFRLNNMQMYIPKSSFICQCCNENVSAEMKMLMQIHAFYRNCCVYSANIKISYRCPELGRVPVYNNIKINPKFKLCSTYS
jgi:hypothetical protein